MSLLPSGIIRQGKLSIIGNGVVLDPWALKTEIDEEKIKDVKSLLTLDIDDDFKKIGRAHV